MPVVKKFHSFPEGRFSLSLTVGLLRLFRHISIIRFQTHFTRRSQFLLQFKHSPSVAALSKHSSTGRAPRLSQHRARHVVGSRFQPLSYRLTLPFSHSMLSWYFMTVRTRQSEEKQGSQNALGTAFGSSTTMTRTATIFADQGFHLINLGNQ